MPTPPPLPSAADTALLLDFDGTLVDIAPTPELVVVPDDLRHSLRVLREKLGGALAIVTGRPLEQVDAFLPDLPGAVAAEHGAVLRRAAAIEPERAVLPALPDGWLPHAAAWAGAHEGVRLEEKRTGFVLHFRQAPDAGPEAHRFLSELVAGAQGRFHVLPAKMAWELRPGGADKGSAVAALMQEAPFAGRLPLFIGDDVTDEHGIEAAIRLGGAGYLVPEAFGEPADVRAWLRGWAAAPE